MKGWLLDPYINGKYAIMWFRLKNGHVIQLKDRYYPTFLAQPKKEYTVDDISWLFNEHPFVHSTKIVERHPSLRRERKEKIVQVKVDASDDLDAVLRYAKRLHEVQEIYNTGLIPIQWHLIHRETPPSSLCEITESQGIIKTVNRLNDDHQLKPPPFNIIKFTIPDKGEINEIIIQDEWLDPVTTLKGDEKQVLSDFQTHLNETDPDMLVTDIPLNTTRHMIRKARKNNVDLRFGREGFRYRGRILVGSSSFKDMGIAGLVERARFTYAPMGVSADWAAGKTIDSRQCAEAVHLNIMVPPMGGGFSFSTWAWDFIRHDKGGMIFSPQPGLHENVAALDFESMFPNIIVKKNVSYETVVEGGIDTSIEGFLGKITEPFLSRRIRFKHMRSDYPKGSHEWWYCQQRQSSLKLFLVVYYGYSGCYSNRFANVRVFQQINKESRKAMVQALQTAQDNGFQVIYGPFDSLFVKKDGATRQSFQELAKTITEVTRLPMGLDHHFKYLVLLTKTTEPSMVTANRYYGKLMDGDMFYRGIEMRRHDTPRFIYKMQENIMETLFAYQDTASVLNEGVKDAQDIVRNALQEINQGRVNPRELVISKRLRREVKEYKARQPHIVAAMLGKNEEMSRYILVNTEHDNIYMRVVPENLLKDTHRQYDKKKYAQMTRRAAWNLLRPFIPDEMMVGSDMLKERSLDFYI